MDDATSSSARRPPRTTFSAKKRWRWVLAVVVAFSLDAAAATVLGTHRSAAPPPARMQPPLGAVPVITEYQQVHRPINAFLPTVDERVQLYQISTAAVNRCLAAGGLPPTATTPADAAAFTAEVYRDQAVRSPLWGFFDTDGYTTRGYLRATNAVSTLPLAAPAGPGGQVGTCIGDGHRALTQFRGATVTDLPDGGPHSAAQDSRWTAAVTTWSACMARHGLNVKTPTDVEDGPAASVTTATGDPTAAGLTQAAADISCKRSTNLVGIGAAVQAAYDWQYILAHQDELTNVSADLKTLLATAPR